MQFFDKMVAQLALEPATARVSLSADRSRIGDRDRSGYRDFEVRVWGEPLPHAKRDLAKDRSQATVHVRTNRDTGKDEVVSVSHPNRV